MGQISQKDAVYKFVCETLGKDFRPGQDVARSLLSSEQIKEIRERMLEGFKDGAIPIGGKPSKWSGELQHYANNIVHNWLRKDPRLNSGKKYKPNRDLKRLFRSDKKIFDLEFAKNTLAKDPTKKGPLKVLNEMIKVRKLVLFLEHESYPFEEIPEEIQIIFGTTAKKNVA